MSTCLVIDTDDDFVFQIGNKVIHSYSELYYEDKELLEKHLRGAQILSVKPWSANGSVVSATDIETAAYFLDYCKQAADALALCHNFKIGGNQTLHLILEEDNLDKYYVD